MNQRTHKKLLLFAAAFLFLSAVICAWLLYLELQKPDVMEEYDYEEVQDLVAVNPPADSSIENTPIEGSSQTNPEQDQTPVLTYDPETLLALNDDFAGWIYIPNTKVNLPVVAGADNKYYLKHSFLGEYSRFGCPFIGIHTPIGSRNLVIHGHNVGQKRTEMFSRLLDYEDQAYAEAHKLIYFTQPGVEGEVYEVFAVLNFDIKDLNDFNYICGYFETEDDFSSFIKYLKDKSVYTTDFIPEGDTIILSTCDRTKPAGKDNRLLICAGKLAPEITGSTDELSSHED